MNDTLVTLQGWVGGRVNLRPAGDGLVASFRLGCTPRNYHRSTDTWVDDKTQWYTVNAWRALGENCEASLRVGDAVVVHGRLRLTTWINGDNVEQQSWEVTATSVGHDLNRGTSRFTKPVREVEPPPQPQEPADESAREEVAA